MKLRIVHAVVLLAFLSLTHAFAQTKPAVQDSSGPSAAAQDAHKPNCPCCQKMTGGKDDKPCCHHEGAAAGDKNTMSCCQGNDKDGMSCMKADTSKSGEATDAKGQCCGGENQKGCCHKSDQSSEQATMACCGGADGHCGATHHEHGEMNK